MTYRGHIRNGQIKLDEPTSLPEGAEVNIQVVGQNVRPARKRAARRIEPIEMPGGSLADELIRERR